MNKTIVFRYLAIEHIMVFINSTKIVFDYDVKRHDDQILFDMFNHINLN
jgi:hypothetical protein